MLEVKTLRRRGTSVRTLCGKVRSRLPVWAGAMALGAQGAALGAMYGSIFPGIGTAAGGFVGGLIGGFMGYTAGYATAAVAIEGGVYVTGVRGPGVRALGLLTALLNRLKGSGSN